MDIRTKLIFALVAISLSSMAALSYFAYQTLSDQLEDISGRQLTALAETKKRDLEKVYESWEGQVRLIRSRPGLRGSLSNFLENGDEETRRTMENTLEAALSAVPNAQSCM